VAGLAGGSVAGLTAPAQPGTIVPVAVLLDGVPVAVLLDGVGVSEDTICCAVTSSGWIFSLAGIMESVAGVGP